MRYCLAIPVTVPSLELKALVIKARLIPRYKAKPCASRFHKISLIF